MTKENHLLRLSQPNGSPVYAIKDKGFMESPLASANWELLSSTMIAHENLKQLQYSDLADIGDETCQLIFEDIKSVIGIHISYGGLIELEDKIKMTQRGLVPVRWVCNTKGGLTLLSLDSSVESNFHVTDFDLMGSNWVSSYTAQGVSIHDAYPLLKK